MYCEELVQEGNGDCCQCLMIFSSDKTIGGKHMEHDMAYVSASCLSDRWRASEKGWAAFATLPNPGKVAKERCPREGPCGQQRRHVEVCQLSWKWMLTTLFEIEHKKLVKVFDIGGELTKVRVGYGFTIADLMQHWKYLGELMGTCPLCRVRKGCMCQPLKAPIKTAEERPGG